MKDAMRELLLEVLPLNNLIDRERAFKCWTKRWVADLESRMTVSHISILNGNAPIQHIANHIKQNLGKSIIRLADLEWKKLDIPNLDAEIHSAKVRVITEHPQYEKEY